MKSDRELLLEKQSGRCCWCGELLKGSPVTVEHIIPRSVGGANTYANKALAHEACNKARDTDMSRDPHPSFLFGFVREILDEYRKANL